MHDVLTFHGEQQPGWWPLPAGSFAVPAGGPGRDGVGVFDAVASPDACAALLAAFAAQPAYPVGVDGYGAAGGPVGSHRAMAWAPELAGALAPAFAALPERLEGRDGDLVGDGVRIPAPFPQDRNYRRLGPTPFMRLMRYESGGMHVPHYDAPFECAAEAYLTLFSWVLYLTDAEERDGGALDFVEDGQAANPRDRPPEAFADWRRMAWPDEVVRSVQPKAGRLLVFPHWLCHQVAPFRGAGPRCIIRGDLAYGWTP